MSKEPIQIVIEDFELGEITDENIDEKIKEQDIAHNGGELPKSDQNN